jgi:hypothetical protein
VRELSALVNESWNSWEFEDVEEFTGQMCSRSASLLPQAGVASKVSGALLTNAFVPDAQGRCDRRTLNEIRSQYARRMKFKEIRATHAAIRQGRDRQGDCVDDALLGIGRRW